jgi:RimJ/RimL family protein N-acetyltransferase
LGEKLNPAPPTPKQSDTGRATLQTFKEDARISARDFEMQVLKTDRLILRRLSERDAEFILGLLNEPSFLRYIGDKGVRTLDDARDYLLNGPLESYIRYGFGLYLVETKEPQISIGICGLIKREALPDVDVGFAFLPEFWNKGYAFESASAVLAYAKTVLKFDRIVAITDIDNVVSGRVLQKLGMRFDRMIKLSETSAEIKLFVLNH